MKEKILKIFKNPWVWFGVVLIIAIVIRVAQINQTSFWYDEAFTGDTVRLSWKEMFNVISEDKVHPPLFYILTRLWANIFGFTQVGLRSFSIFWGVCAVGVVFVGIKNIFEKNKFPIAALLTSFALAISPFFVAYSNEARAYSFLAFLAVSIGFLVIKVLDADTKKSKLIYFVLSVLAISLLCGTHYLQVVFVIALVCAVFIYKVIWNEKGVNKKWLLGSLGFVGLVMMALIFLPIKAFVNGKGISGMWWIPDVQASDLLRVFYSYFFGVVRDALGVPPLREMVWSISWKVVASFFAFVYFFSLVKVLRAKDLSILFKRHIIFLASLGIITFVGFYILGIIGFNAYVERYMIAGGIILFVSFFLNMTFVLRGGFKIIPILIYLVFISLLKPLPYSIDYRQVANTLDNISNVTEYVFDSPIDFVSAKFYIDDSGVYYAYDYAGEYSGWALLDDDENGIDIGNLHKGSIVITSSENIEKYKERGFTVLTSIESLYILSL